MGPIHAVVVLVVSCVVCLFTAFHLATKDSIAGDPIPNPRLILVKGFGFGIAIFVALFALSLIDSGDDEPDPPRNPSSTYEPPNFDPDDPPGNNCYIGDC